MDAAKILAETGCTMIGEPWLAGRDHDIFHAVFEFEGRRVEVAVSYKLNASRAVPATLEDAIIEQLRYKGLGRSEAPAG